MKKNVGNLEEHPVHGGIRIQLFPSFELMQILVLLVCRGRCDVPQHSANRPFAFASALCFMKFVIPAATKEKL